MKPRSRLEMGSLAPDHQPTKGLLDELEKLGVTAKEHGLKQSRHLFEDIVFRDEWLNQRLWVGTSTLELMAGICETDAGEDMYDAMVTLDSGPLDDAMGVRDDPQD